MPVTQCRAEGSACESVSTSARLYDFDHSNEGGQPAGAGSPPGPAPRDTRSPSADGRTARPRSCGAAASRLFSSSAHMTNVAVRPARVLVQNTPDGRQGHTPTMRSSLARPFVPNADSRRGCRPSAERDGPMAEAAAVAARSHSRAGALAAGAAFSIKAKAVIAGVVTLAYDAHVQGRRGRGPSSPRYPRPVRPVRPSRGAASDATRGLLLNDGQLIGRNSSDLFEGALRLR